MTTIDKIRAEIERRIKSCDATSKTPNQLLWAELSALLPFLDTLEEPEQHTMGYDEAYLNEKIAKASKTWKGVDVDKYMDEVRGREPASDELEEAAEKYRFFDFGTPDEIAQTAFKAGAEWQKRKMMEGAVEVWNVVEEGRYCPEIGPIFLDERAGFRPGDKVKIIIVKEGEQ